MSMDSYLKPDISQWRVGRKVHVDTQNDEWGRVTSDGEIVRVNPHCQSILVNCETIRANIYVPMRDARLITRREMLHRQGREDRLAGKPCGSANGAYLDGWYSVGK